MVSDRFVKIVENAKQQEMRIQELEERNEVVAKESMDIQIKEVPGQQHERTPPAEVLSHKDITSGVPGVTFDKDIQKFRACIRFKTGPNTSTSKNVTGINTLMGAIIARNKVAAALFAEGLIDEAKFAKITKIPDGLFN